MLPQIIVVAGDLACARVLDLVVRSFAGEPVGPGNRGRGTLLNAGRRHRRGRARGTGAWGEVALRSQATSDGD